MADLIENTLAQIQQVIKDLQARPDYGANQKASVKDLNSFALLLKKYDAASTPSSSLTEEVKTDANDNMLPMLGDLIDDNIKITKMQALNTERTISPKMANDHNVNLEALQSDVQHIAADPGTAAPPADEDLDPDEAAAALLIELMSSEITNDPTIAENLERISGRAEPCSC